MKDQDLAIITAVPNESHNSSTGYPDTTSKEGYFVQLTAAPAGSVASATSTLLTALPTAAGSAGVASVAQLGLLLSAADLSKQLDDVALPGFTGIVKVAVPVSNPVTTPFTFGMLQTDGSVVPNVNSSNNVKVCRFIEISGTNAPVGTIELLRATLIEPVIQ